MNKLPQIVILGRPNVGKSTLFNRLCGRRRALVGNEPGMTRDRIYAPAEWQGKRFEVVDTGGIIPADVETIPKEILRQARVAIENAAHLVIVVDGRQGIVPADEELVPLLRRTGRPMTLAVNKIDTPSHESLIYDFRSLGIKDVFPISAEHCLGVDDLLDHLTANLPATEEASEGGEVIKVAIIGRPNVGKSTLLNSLVKEERSIVTPLAGTTRDAVDADVVQDGVHFRFVDTAGIRRKGKTKLLAEKLSVVQARKHLERADVALLVLDAVEGVTALDANIGGYAHESHRSVIIVVNKWDAVKQGSAPTRESTLQIRETMKYLDYAPIVFVSALREQRLGKLLGVIQQVAAARKAARHHRRDQPLPGRGGF